MPKYSTLALMETSMTVTPGSRSAGAINGSVINAIGFDRVMYVIAVGELATGAGIKFEIRQSATSSGTYTYLSGARMTELLAATGKNTHVVIDVPVSASYPYQKAAGTAGTAAVNCSVIAIMYNGKTRPPTQEAAEVLII